MQRMVGRKDAINLLPLAIEREIAVKLNHGPSGRNGL